MHIQGYSSNCNNNNCNRNISNNNNKSSSSSKSHCSNWFLSSCGLLSFFFCCLPLLPLRLSLLFPPLHVAKKYAKVISQQQQQQQRERTGNTFYRYRYSYNCRYRLRYTHTHAHTHSKSNIDFINNLREIAVEYFRWTACRQTYVDMCMYLDTFVSVCWHVKGRSVFELFTWHSKRIAVWDFGRENRQFLNTNWVGNVVKTGVLIDRKAYRVLRLQSSSIHYYYYSL